MCIFCTRSRFRQRSCGCGACLWNRSVKEKAPTRAENASVPKVLSSLEVYSATYSDLVMGVWSLCGFLSVSAESRVCSTVRRGVWVLSGVD